LSRVVIRVSADAERTHHRQPARQALAYRALGDLHADALGHALGHRIRHAAEQQAVAHAHHQVAERLRGGVAEQAPQHLLAAQFRVAAVGGGDIADHLRLDLPDRDQFRQHGKPAQRPRRQRQRAGGERGSLRGAVGDAACLGLRLAAGADLAARDVADEVEDRAGHAAVVFRGDHGGELLAVVAHAGLGDWGAWSRVESRRCR